MEEERSFLVRQKEDLKTHLLRAPSRRWWGFVGLVASLAMIYYGLPSSDTPRIILTALPPFGVLEGMGAFFGSLAELLPEEQATLAGILRVWAGLFVVCGLGLMVVGGLPGS